MSALCYVRPAVVKDIPLVVSIHNSWSLDNVLPRTEKGFFLRSCGEDRFISQLDNPNSLFLVAETANQVEGYILAYRHAPDIQKLIWMFPDDVRLLTEERHLYVDQVGVAPNALNRGVGKALYTRIISGYPDSSLSAFVAVTPYNNASSHALHQKMGFRASARFEDDEFMNLKNYSSTLYIKPPKSIP
jgi:L-amino acid N-acyltransferase YncA